MVFIGLKKSTIFFMQACIVFFGLQVFSDDSEILLREEPVVIYGQDADLVHVRDVAIDGETVFVLTDSAPFLHVFSSQGYQSWGEKGEGPGDLVNPRAVRVQNGTAMILNLRPNKIVLFDYRGRLKETLAIKQAMLVHKFEYFDGKFFVETGSFGSDVREVILLDGHSSKTILEFSQPEKVTLKDPGGPIGLLSLVQPYAPQARWLWTNDGSLMFWDGKGKNIRLLDKKLRPQSSFTVLMKKLPLQPGDEGAWLDDKLPADTSLFGMKNAYRNLREIATEKMSFPKQFPLMMEVIADPRGGFWIMRSKSVGGQVWTWIKDKKACFTLRLPVGKHFAAIGTERFVLVSESDRGELISLYLRRN